MRSSTGELFAKLVKKSRGLLFYNPPVEVVHHDSENVTVSTVKGPRFARHFSR